MRYLKHGSENYSQRLEAADGWFSEVYSFVTHFALWLLAA